MMKLSETSCGQCVSECDQNSGMCIEGCLSGWIGLGCHINCSSKEESCTNPCQCRLACQCDVQLLSCSNFTNCTVSSRPNRAVDDNDTVLILFTATFTAIGMFLIVGSSFCCAARHRRQSGSRRLRGHLMSLPCFKYCPQWRDWLLKKGVKFGLASLQLGAKDSLETITDEYMAVEQSLAFRHWRRQKATVVGVREDKPIIMSAASGYRWKKKWRDRKEASKQKRKMRYHERKLRRLGLQRKPSLILPPISTPEGQSGLSSRRGSVMRIPNFNTLFSRRGSMLPRAGTSPAPVQRPGPGSLPPYSEQSGRSIAQAHQMRPSSSSTASSFSSSTSSRSAQSGIDRNPTALANSREKSWKSRPMAAVPGVQSPSSNIPPVSSSAVSAAVEMGPGSPSSSPGRSPIPERGQPMVQTAPGSEQPGSEERANPTTEPEQSDIGTTSTLEQSASCFFSTVTSFASMAMKQPDRSSPSSGDSAKTSTSAGSPPAPQ